ncbi:galactokinase [Clostridium acidisoli DSM 12555]|uniref:Galactokinase n=1 Tax=Clostridium acidisoli DSM 12555 TaxID=1121291 RepID=A0A1W1X2Q8_9CLOT|nr:galactokinase [Clostridium acidisoli]SMC18187.1 galactokinase [Clostridium acidisoli DSM 12555]
MDINKLEEIFQDIYGAKSEFCFFSPGRINLIGEHIDYNGGLVFPCALDFGTYALVSLRDDNKLNFTSTNFDLKVCNDLDNLAYNKEDDWANYPKGVIKIMQDKGYKTKGMNILISGNIPNGAGLSSSASLEVLTGVIINNLFNEGKIDRVELVKIAQKAENEFVGVNCGIMDQFAVGLGKTNKAILLDCNSLNYKYADMKLLDYSIVIMNTNKRRALNESKYNERRAECEEALKIIQKEKNVQNLCKLTPEEFDALEHIFTDEKIKNRAKHAVYENDRVISAFDCLNKGELEEFGRLLMESHDSLKNLYEVTGIELDSLVEEALKNDGCIGARMTGAGFGGCAIALVKTDKISSFTDEVRKAYTERIGYKPSFYSSGIGNGTHQIR